MTRAQGASRAANWAKGKERGGEIQTGRGIAKKIEITMEIESQMLTWSALCGFQPLLKSNCKDAKGSRRTQGTKEGL
jgi:hypothetical protein